MPRTESVFAFIAEDTGPDDEGIIGAYTSQGWAPLVRADLARVESLRPIALGVAKRLGKQVKLVHFTNRVEVEAIIPTWHLNGY